MIWTGTIKTLEYEQEIFTLLLIYENMRIWSGKMETWQYGNMTIWKHDNMETWQYEKKKWKHDNMENENMNKKYRNIDMNYNLNCTFY